MTECSACGRVGSRGFRRHARTGLWVCRNANACARRWKDGGRPTSCPAIRVNLTTGAEYQCLLPKGHTSNPLTTDHLYEGPA